MIKGDLRGVPEEKLRLFLKRHRIPLKSFLSVEDRDGSKYTICTTKGTIDVNGDISFKRGVTIKSKAGTNKCGHRLPPSATPK